MTVGDRIRTIRIEKNLSQVYVADKANITKQLLYKYENGIITNIPSDKIEAIAQAMNTTPANIMGWESSKEKPSSSSGVVIPVLGRVAAGIPIEAIEEIIDTEEITQELARKGEYFGLRIKGDSMNPAILDGDTVIVRRQAEAETGETVVALINGHDGVCKKLRILEDGIMLISLNPKYDPLVFTAKEIESEPVRIMGKVVELRRKF